MDTQTQAQGQSLEGRGHKPQTTHPSQRRGGALPAPQFPSFGLVTVRECVSMALGHLAVVICYGGHRGGMRAPAPGGDEQEALSFCLPPAGRGSRLAGSPQGKALLPLAFYLQVDRPRANVRPGSGSRPSVGGGQGLQLTMRTRAGCPRGGLLWRWTLSWVLWWPEARRLSCAAWPSVVPSYRTAHRVLK